MLLDDGEELDGHAAGLFYAALPLLHRGLAGVEGAGKDGLADALALANPVIVPLTNQTLASNVLLGAFRYESQDYRPAVLNR